MTIHSHIRADHREGQKEGSPKPMAGGLWKLLVAAILILFGLIVAMEAFGDGDKHFTAPDPAQQTVFG